MFGFKLWNLYNLEYLSWALRIHNWIIFRILSLACANAQTGLQGKHLPCTMRSVPNTSLTSPPLVLIMDPSPWPLAYFQAYQLNFWVQGLFWICDQPCGPHKSWQLGYLACVVLSVQLKCLFSYHCLFSMLICAFWLILS